MRKHVYLIAILLFCASFLATAQDYVLEVTPANPSIELDESVTLTAVLKSKDGKIIKNATFNFYSRNSRAITVSDEGKVSAIQPGENRIIVLGSDEQGNRARKDITVNVKYPPVTTVSIVNAPVEVYAGTRTQLDIQIKDSSGAIRDNVSPSMKSSNTEVGTVDPRFNFFARTPGKSTITASVGNITGKVNVTVVPAPEGKLRLSANKTEVRTGDVVHLSAMFKNTKGESLEGMPVYYTFYGEADDVSSSASGLIKQDGRFVADVPGDYTITASVGELSDQLTIRANPRNVQREVKFIGHGNVTNKHTSDFWVWEGVDGRDYAVTGTWGADGTAYFWDVTNPGNIKKIDSVQVDARTVNDVKISEDGTICIISREGASTRKNGIVIIDVKDPSKAEIISTFTENLTGGVHNLFISEGHVYALSAGRKYYSINIEDPKNPKIVGEFELDAPGHSIHDVWVDDGIAYSSNWRDGIQLVDVGNGIAGGSPSNPVQFAEYAYPSGANHATFPFKSKSANKFYVVGGDEIFPYGLNFEGPNIAGGFLHFVDFTDLDNPEEIARFEVPGAGSHNYWIQDEILYVAFYNGGVRMVDISGELMGDLFKQGREIGWYIPSSPEGYIPNSPFTWGAQPHKGHIFMSDWNSGLWSIQLEPEKPGEVTIDTK